MVGDGSKKKDLEVIWLQEIADSPRFRRVYHAAVENLAKLHSCPLHRFETIHPDSGAVDRCTECGGFLGVVEAYWYQMGLIHGRGEKLDDHPELLEPPHRGA